MMGLLVRKTKTTYHFPSGITLLGHWKQCKCCFVVSRPLQAHLPCARPHFSSSSSEVLRVHGHPDQSLCSSKRLVQIFLMFVSCLVPTPRRRLIRRERARDGGCDVRRISTDPPSQKLNFIRIVSN